ncbi:MAG: hypothetical protein ACKPKO_43465, partial [Candidatus Fonsibacter sp.]
GSELESLLQTAQQGDRRDKENTDGEEELMDDVGWSLFDESPPGVGPHQQEDSQVDRKDLDTRNEGEEDKDEQQKTGLSREPASEGHPADGDHTSTERYSDRGL